MAAAGYTIWNETVELGFDDNYNDIMIRDTYERSNGWTRDEAIEEAERMAAGRSDYLVAVLVKSASGHTVRRFAVA